MASDDNSSSSSPSWKQKDGSVTPHSGDLVQRFTFKVDHMIPIDNGPSAKRDKRMLRKDCEKNRRDRLNRYIGELAKIVPLVMKSNKKIDKASVLRLTVAYLRIYYDLVLGHKRKRQSVADDEIYDNLAALLLDTLGGFLLVVNSAGVLVFTTESITKYLGHNQVDVLGFPIYKLVHNDDHEIFRQQFELSAEDWKINDVEDHGEIEHVPVRGHRSFSVRMQNILNQQNVRHDTVNVVGHIRTMPLWSDSAPDASRRKSEVCLVAVATVEPRKPVITELYPILNDVPKQWITRHDLDGKITYSDQRGACLTGFLPGESIGFSAYHLVHPEDIPVIVTLHNHFLKSGTIPKSVFRMFTKSRDILYIGNSTHLVVDLWTSRPKFIISINEVVDSEEGEKALEKQRQLARTLADEESVNTASETNDMCDNRTLAVECSSPSNTCSSGSQVIIPEVVEYLSELKVSVVLGDQAFVVDMTRCSIAAKPNVNSIVADPYTPEVVTSVPLVKPTFLGSDNENMSPRSCDSKCGSEYGKSLADVGSPDQLLPAVTVLDNGSSQLGSNVDPDMSLLLEDGNQFLASAAYLARNQNNVAETGLTNHMMLSSQDVSACQVDSKMLIDSAALMQVGHGATSGRTWPSNTLTAGHSTPLVLDKRASGLDNQLKNGKCSAVNGFSSLSTFNHPQTLHTDSIHGRNITLGQMDLAMTAVNQQDNRSVGDHQLLRKLLTSNVALASSRENPSYGLLATSTIGVHRVPQAAAGSEQQLAANASMLPHLCSSSAASLDSNVVHPINGQQKMNPQNGDRLTALNGDLTNCLSEKMCQMDSEDFLMAYGNPVQTLSTKANSDHLAFPGCNRAADCSSPAADSPMPITDPAVSWFGADADGLFNYDPSIEQELTLFDGLDVMDSQAVDSFFDSLA